MVKAMQEKTLKSAIYKGWVQHRRFSPKEHQFKYQVFMMYLDLDEIDAVLSKSYFWSSSKYALARFKRSDYLGKNNSDLKQLVLDKVEDKLGKRPDGAVRLLTNCRYFGFIMNPLSIYYCFDAREQLQAMLLEVTNTPWKDRHQYVLACDPGERVQRIPFNKQMHVSPFHPMNMQYRLNSELHDDELKFHLSNSLVHEPDKKVFDASLLLKREDVTGSALSRVILAYPFMTFKVLGAIYWQALKLFIKRVPLHPYIRKTA
ncbi:hypothetical protein SAMN02745866_03021 [Alteromonadaceae bacterium Bs31]|nr:hypothetical protein SAMN02745866_03021 [Alteromonadaceae bacterium Bs31]